MAKKKTGIDIEDMMEMLIEQLGSMDKKGSARMDKRRI